MGFFLRRGSMMRIVTFLFAGGIIFLVVTVVILRATDGESGNYENVTKTARKAYSSIGAGSPTETTPRNEKEPTYQAEITAAAEVVANPGLGLSTPALKLLPGRVEEELPIVQTTQAESQAMGSTVDEFIDTWETFHAADPGYERRLQKIGATGSGVVSRRDNRQQEGVGACASCNIGSRFASEYITPSDYMIVRGYNGNSAYVTTEAVVEYGRGEGIYNRYWRREYALILTKNSSGWKVARAIAETKGPEQ